LLRAICESDFFCFDLSCGNGLLCVVRTSSEYLADVIDASMDIVTDSNADPSEVDYRGPALIMRLEAAARLQAEEKQRQAEELRRRQELDREWEQQNMNEEGDNDGSRSHGSHSSPSHRKSSISTIKSYLRPDGTRRDSFLRRSVTSIRASQSSK
jgi:hypothetical protein